MPYDPDRHHRRSIRLAGYDYAQGGAYFVTICTYERQTFFGTINDGSIQLNDLGRAVDEEWKRSGEIRRELDMDQWVIMPNHLHGIVLLDSPEAESTRNSQFGPLTPRSIAAFVRGFKAATTKRVNILCQNFDSPLWQRNYYEHIIRNELTLSRLRDYMADNPAKWEIDTLHPNNPSSW